MLWSILFRKYPNIFANPAGGFLPPLLQLFYDFFSDFETLFPVYISVPDIVVDSGFEHYFV